MQRKKEATYPANGGRSFEDLGDGGLCDGASVVFYPVCPRFDVKI